MATLPLFPLGTVLLPGARIPLQLFEPRYLELARHLAARDEDDRRFGVTLIRAGHEVGPDAVADLYEIGCEARVDAMALADSAIGTMVHLVATGTRRYRLEALEDDAGTPWTTGRVCWLDEPTAGEPGDLGGPDDTAHPFGTGQAAESTVEDLAQRALREHAAYLFDLGAKVDTVEAGPTQLAYRIVEAMVLDASDRQRVLEGGDPATRLRTVIALLRREPSSGASGPSPRRRCRSGRP